MEIRLDLRTATLKDAEHAIFLIGAYFGLTQQTVHDIRITAPAQDVQTGPVPAFTPPGPVAARALDVVGTAMPGMPPVTTPGLPLADVAQEIADPAATFGTTPPVLPPEANEDPAAVFAGNVAPAPVAPIAAGPVGMPPAPTPAPPASAPTAPTVSGVETDATGLPWDGRIHASGEGGAKPKNADGKWRKKRGLNDAALVAKVEAELRATMAAAPVAPPAMPTPPQAQAPAPVAPPAMPTPPAAAVDPTTFPELMTRVTPAVIAGIVAKDALSQAAAAYGVASVPMLANRPDLIPSVWAYLRSLYPNIQ